MKNNKRGIALVVTTLAILECVLGAGIMYTVDSTADIIDKANQAIQASDLAQVRSIAALAWSEAYIDKFDDPTVDIEAKVLAALQEEGVNLDKYEITVTENGVNVELK